MPVVVHAAVVINEIVPKTDPPTGEWVEFYNTDSSSVSLNQWKLDHTSGDGKSFILNASEIIQPHGFLTVTGSQTAISFDINGDAIRLFDANGTLVDQESYPGTLGYNTSMGRTVDGGGVWTLCTAATYNTNNNCPQPSPTATPPPAVAPTNTPSPKPTATPTPAGVPTATPIPTQETFGTLLGAATAVTSTPIPTPTPKDDNVLQFTVQKMWIVYTLMAIAAAALSLMVAMWVRQRQKRKKI